jgi:uncharacterized membrane protein
MAFKPEILPYVAHVFIQQGSAVRSLHPFSRMSTGLWFVPLMCVLAGVGLSFGTIAIDKAYDYELIPQSISGGPDAALEILGTVAASMVSLAGIRLRRDTASPQLLTARA